MKWQHKNTLSVLELQAALGLHGVGPAQWPCSAVNTERANTSGPCKGCRWAFPTQVSLQLLMPSPPPPGCRDRRGEAALAPRARDEESLNPSDT